MSTVFIGIDDTDNPTSPGTGQLARRLVEQILPRGAVSLGVTRHQLLVDDRIPYTRQNRGVCIAIDWSAPLDELNFALDDIAAWSAPGSDPGVCIASADAVTAAILAFGLAATTDVLFPPDAIATAAAAGIKLAALNNTDQGVIGALACVGLRAGGNNGRFVDLPGLRLLGEVVTAEQLLRMGIGIDHQTPGHTGPVPAARYKTFGWVRPRLIHGKPVWLVQWSQQHDAWISIDQKRIRPGRSPVD